MFQRLNLRYTSEILGRSLKNGPGWNDLSAPEPVQPQAGIILLGQSCIAGVAIEFRDPWKRVLMEKKTGPFSSA